MGKILFASALLLLGVPGTAMADVAIATARAKSKDFVSNETVPCAQEVGQALGQCEAKVARAGASAAVVVTFQNGFSRMLTFSDSAFIRGNATMSGVGTDTDWRLADGIFFVRVDDQRYELPEALVFGN